MRDPDALHHAVGQAEHTYYVDIFQRIAKIFANVDQEAAPEIDNIGKWKTVFTFPAA